MNELIIVVLIVGTILLGLWLTFAVTIGAIATAATLFAWAAEYGGVIGVALYVIVWVVATPVMLVVCIIGGIVKCVGWWVESREESRFAKRRGQPY